MNSIQTTASSRIERSRGTGTKRCVAKELLPESGCGILKGRNPSCVSELTRLRLGKEGKCAKVQKSLCSCGLLRFCERELS